ncbi:MAG: ADOP family duplicated permease [Gemmatimonadales bacterium]
MKRAWWRFGRREDELSEEIESHLAMAIEERVARGEARAEATAAARRQFGNRETVRGTAREMWGWVWLEQLMIDLRYGLRKLRLAPGFTAVAALSLAIGIGATVTMYAVVDAADIRGLPYPRADQLVVIEQTTATRSRPDGPEVVRASPAPEATTAAWLGASRSFSAASRVGGKWLRWVHDDEAEQLELSAVGPQFFPMLGATPLLGRTIAPSDTNADAPAVIVLSYTFWRDRFSSDRHVVGQHLALDTSETPSAPHVTYDIIGVMPRQVDYPAATNGWTADRAGSRAWSVVLARLGRGKTAAAASAELRAVTQGVPVAAGESEPPGVRVTGLREAIHSKWSGPADINTIDSALGRAVRLGVVVFVLIIAMINVGNLLLARSAARDHEMRVRSALGASRARLAQQVLVEGGCIALFGGSAGVLLARWGIGVAASFGALRTNGIVPVLDWRVLLFALALTIVVALGSGFIPVLALVRGSGDESPKASAGRARTRLQGALLAAQVAAALTLLTGAGVLSKELLRLEKQGFGLDPTNLLVFPILQRPAGMPSVQFREDVLFGLSRVPGVMSVSEYEAFLNGGFYPAGDRALAGTTIFDHQDIAISPGFLRNLGIPIKRGRDFTEADYSAETPVALVSTAAAKRFWPGEDPVGKHVIVPPPMRRKGDTATAQPFTVTVVGVTGDVRLGRVLGPPPMTLMRPVSTKAGVGMSFFVRTAGNTDATLPALRRELSSLQRAPLVHANYGSLQAIGIDRQLAEEKVTTRTLIAFATVALLLATLGIHGLVSYAVAQRTREIGIRMALGAESNSVLLLVTRRGLALAAVGVVFGLAGSFALSRAIRAMLYGTSPTDATVFAGSALLLAVTVLVASYLPARRATRVDPMVALRVD